MYLNLMLAVYLFPCALALLRVSCSGPQPAAATIPEEKVVELYAHVLILQQEGTLTGADSSAMKARTDSLYAAFHLTRDQAQTAMRYYRDDLPRWRGVLEKVIRRLEQLQRDKLPG